MDSFIYLDNHFMNTFLADSVAHMLTYVENNSKEMLLFSGFNVYLLHSWITH